MSAWPSSDARPKRGYSPGLRDRVLGLLRVAAIAGRVCPSNRTLARDLQVTEEQVKVCLRRLVLAGSIRIDAGSPGWRGRVVTVLDCGRSTAGLRAEPAPPAAPAPEPAAAAEPVEEADLVEGAEAAPALPPRRQGRQLRAVPSGVRFACESILDAPDHQVRTGCGWIEGDDGHLAAGAWSYCNRPVLVGAAWCAGHYRRCYTPRGEAS